MIDMDQWSRDRELRARLVAARIAEPTPCACSAEATQLICSLPARWVCRSCFVVELEQARAETQKPAATLRLRRGLNQ